MNTLTRRQRAEQRAAGPRGTDGLTDADRQLLDTVRALGWDIQSHFMIGPDGNTYHHKRGVVKAKPSWSHSIR